MHSEVTSEASEGVGTKNRGTHDWRFSSLFAFEGSCDQSLFLLSYLNLIVVAYDDTFPNVEVKRQRVGTNSTMMLLTAAKGRHDLPWDSVARHYGMYSHARL